MERDINIWVLQFDFVKSKEIKRYDNKGILPKD